MYPGLALKQRVATIHRKGFPTVQSSALDRRDVDKHLSAGALRLNKSIAFGRVEWYAPAMMLAALRAAAGLYAVISGRRKE